eukprot:g6967.t1
MIMSADRLADRLLAAQQARAVRYARLLAGDNGVATFDIVVLMVQDDAQASAFRAEVEAGVEAGLYPRQSRYHFFPDRPEKCGNGGAIIASLHALAQEYTDRQLDEARVLLLPCGGYSQRLPQYGPRGKIFAPVPFVLPDSGAARVGEPGGCAPPCTMLQLKLLGYLDIVERMPPGASFVAWSDVLVFFDAGDGAASDAGGGVGDGAGDGARHGTEMGRAQVTGAGCLDLGRPGFTVFGHTGSVDYGVAHAVMVLEPGDAARALSSGHTATYACRHFFEKASERTLRAAGAVIAAGVGAGAQEERVIVDSDFLFDRETARLLLRFHAKHAPFKAGDDIDAGSHMQMASARPFRDPGAQTSPPAPAPPPLFARLCAPCQSAISAFLGDARAQSTGRALFDFIAARGVPLHTALLLPSTFYHIGTMAEYLQHYTRGIPELGGATLAFTAEEGTGSERAGASSQELGQGQGQGQRQGQGQGQGRCALHSLFRTGARQAPGSIVEFCRLGEGCDIGEGSIVSNACVPEGAVVPPHTFVHTLAVRAGDAGEGEGGGGGGGGSDAAQGYVTFVFDIARDEIKCKKPEEQTFFGTPILRALGNMNMPTEAAWADGTPRDLWNARVFRVARTREQSFALSMRLATGPPGRGDGGGEGASGGSTVRAMRVSMRGAFDVKWMEREAVDRAALRSDIEEMLSKDRPPHLLETDLL